MKRLLLTATLFLLAAPAIAEPLTYRIDPNHTQVLASWSHFGYSHPSANFGQADGNLVYDADDIAASSVQIVLPLSGLDTFVPKLDAHLRGPDFFDAGEYPVITFKSSGVEVASEGKLKVTGDLTIKGITRPVVLDVAINRVGPQSAGGRQKIGFDAVATVQRSDFGLDKLVPMVSDTVTLRITTEASVPVIDASN